MAVTRWNSFNNVSMFRGTMDRIFDDFFNRPRRHFGVDGLRMLPIDMYETPNGLVVQAHLRGGEANDVTLNVERNTLIIQAHLPTVPEKE